MPDIFDTITADKPDVFDRVGGDVFDRIGSFADRAAALTPPGFLDTVSGEGRALVGAGKEFQRFAGSIPEGLARVSTTPSQLEYAPTMPGAGFGVAPSRADLLQPPTPPANIPRTTESLNKRYLDMLRGQDPLYRVGKVAAEAGEPTPEEQKDFWFKAGGYIGQAAPMALGPLAPAAFTLNSVGESVATDYDRIKREQPGISDNDAADKALQLSTEKGAITAGTFTLLPKILRGPLEKYLVNKWGTTAFRNWLAGRAAAGIEGATLMGGQAAGEQALEGKAPDANTAKAAAGGLLFNILMPWREGQEQAKTARGEPPAAPETPAAAPTVTPPVSTGKDTPAPAQPPGIVSVGDAFQKALEAVSKRSGVPQEDLVETITKAVSGEPEPENQILPTSGKTVKSESAPSQLPEIQEFTQYRKLTEDEQTNYFDIGQYRIWKRSELPNAPPGAFAMTSDNLVDGKKPIWIKSGLTQSQVFDALNHEMGHHELGFFPKPGEEKYGSEPESVDSRLKARKTPLPSEPQSTAQPSVAPSGEVPAVKLNPAFNDIHESARKAARQDNPIGGESRTPTKGPGLPGSEIRRQWDIAYADEQQKAFASQSAALKMAQSPLMSGEKEPPPKPARRFFIRPRSDGQPDILDAIQELGGIRPPGKEDTGGEYDGWKEAMQGTARLLSNRGAKHRPDTILAELQEMGYPRIDSADKLYDAIRSATAGREALRTGGGGPQAREQRFWEAATNPKNPSGLVKISVDDLKVGHKFRLKGPDISAEELEVTHIDPDTNEVTVKDGRKMGVQTLPEGTEIWVQRKYAPPDVSTLSVRHAAGEEPEETISQAAVRTHDGDIYTGKAHFEAVVKANREGKSWSDEDLGFVTSRGRFVDRSQAELIAMRNGQLKSSIDDPSMVHASDFKWFGKPESQHAAGDFSFDQPESVEQQRARQDRERREEEERDKAASLDAFRAGRERAIRDRLQQRIGGDMGSAGQGEMFGQPGGQEELFTPKAPAPKPPPGELFARGQRRGMSVEDVTAAIHDALGTTELPRGIAVTRGERAPWGARIDNRNKITVNAAQISSPERAQRVIMEEGLHGVWNDPRVQNAWEKIRRSVTPEDMRRERDLRQRQGLPSDLETIREEAAISKLLDADANKGVWAELYDAIRKAFKEAFGIDLPAGHRDVLKDAAVEFLKGRRDSLPGRRLVAGNAIVTAPGVSPEYAAMAYHGTPHKITDRFQTSKIGTGEGAQVYGWGLYFAENPAVAEQYAARLSNRGGGAPSVAKIDGKPVEDQNSFLAVALRNLESMKGTTSDLARRMDVISDLEYRLHSQNADDPNFAEDSREIEEAISTIRSLDLSRVSVSSGGGKTYTVRLNVSPDDLLDWDKPLSEQPQGIRDSDLMDKYLTTGGSLNDDGSRFYRWLSHAGEPAMFRESDSYASKRLSDAGIRGVRYADQLSRGRGEWKLLTGDNVIIKSYDTESEARRAADNYTVGEPVHVERRPNTHNYVIFDDKDIAITHENGQPIPLEQAINQPVFAAGEYLPSESEGQDWRDIHTQREAVTQELSDLSDEIAKAGGRRNASTEIKNRYDQANAKHKALTAQLREQPGYVEYLLNQFNATTDDLEREGLKGELTMIAPDLLNRVYRDMQTRGIIAPSQKLPEPFASLQGLTDWLRAHDIESPKRPFRERLNLARRAADAYYGTRDTLLNAWAHSVAFAKTQWELFKHPPIDDDFRSIVKDWNAADEQSGLESYRWQQEINRQVTDPGRRSAIMVWIQAGGSLPRLLEQAVAVPDRFKPVWEAATKLTADEKKLANQIRADWADKLEIGKNAGLIDEGRENYGPTVWSTPPQVAEGDSTFAQAGALQTKRGTPGNPNARLDPRDPFFSFHKSYPTFFEGIMNGGVPATMDVGKLVAHYNQAFNKSLSSRAVIKAMMDAKAKDGRPVVVLSGRADPLGGDGIANRGYVVDARYKGQDAQTADGRPYEGVDHFALKDWKFLLRTEDGKPILSRADMLVHPDHVRFLENVLKPSPLRKYAVVRGALKMNRFLKESKFALSPFHLATLGEHALSHTVNPWTGNFKLDLNVPEQRGLVRGGLDMGFSGERVDFQEGLSSHGGLWSKVPGIGDLSVKFTDFIFKDYLPSIKMKMALEALERNQKRYSKKLTQEQIYDLTASQANAAFGSQNYRLLGRNPIVKDLLSLAFVAPDFLTSRMKFVGQALKPYGQEQRRALAIMTGTLFVGARVINALVDPDNDAHWSPKDWFSVVYNGRRYALRTVTNDIWHAITDPRSFWYNRLSPITRGAIEVSTGKDWRGINRSNLEQLEDVFSWIVPASAEGFVPGAKKRDTGIGESIGRAVGVMSRKDTAETEVRDMARRFNRRSEDPAARNFQKSHDQGTDPDSQFRDLDTLLEANDLTAAKKEYDRLLNQGHKSSKVAARYKNFRPFTGTRKRDEEFYNSLSDSDRKLVDRAREDHQQQYERFLKMFKDSEAPVPEE